MRRVEMRSICGLMTVVLLGVAAGPVYSEETAEETAQEMSGMSIEEGSVQAILQSYVDDFTRDPTLGGPLTFGIDIEGQWWNVTTEPGEEGAPHRVELAAGAPETPSFYFKVDRDTLGRMDRGEMSPGTALSGSRAERLMNVDGTEGYQPGPDGMSAIFSTAFHFWKRGNPEIFLFGELATLPQHGAQVGILYYQPGFRSAWVSIEPGQHANAEAEDQTNPFSSMLIFVNGRGKARIGGEEVEMQGGEAVMIPAGVAHEFWNPFDEPFQGFMLAFGEGA